MYLKPRGLCMMESRVSREEACEFLRSVECGMLGLAVTERSPRELAEGRDRLFRAILLDAVSMLELIGETELKEKLRIIQGQLLAALKEDKPQILQDRISMPTLDEAIGIYDRLIQAHIAIT